MINRQTGNGRKGFSSLLLVAILLCLCGGAVAIAQGTAEPASGEALTLSECVRIALDGNATLLVAEAQRASAEQAVKRAKGAFLPSLSLSGNYTKYERTDFDTPIDPFDPASDLIDVTQKSTSKGYDGQANLNLFSGFSKFATLGAARHDLDAARATALYNRELVVQYVATAYYNLLRNERLRDVAVETRDRSQRELERTETYFRLGSAAKSDVLQARVRLEQTHLDLVIAENRVEQTFADLAYAMNQPLMTRFQIDRSPLATDFEIEDVDLLYGEAMNNRLDLKSRSHVVEARGKDVTSASSGLWPSVDVFYGMGRDFNDSQYRWGSSKSGNKFYGARVNWNVFDRFSTLTGRSQAKANARIAEYNYTQAELQAQVEIRQLHNSLLQAREKVKLSRQTIESAQEELRLAQERFRVGAGTTLDRIMAEVDLAAARAEEVQAICDYLINKVSIERAVGRFSPLAQLGSE